MSRYRQHQLLRLCESVRCKVANARRAFTSVALCRRRPVDFSYATLATEGAFAEYLANSTPTERST